jgi:hypothetical protein
MKKYECKIVPAEIEQKDKIELMQKEQKIYSWGGLEGWEAFLRLRV